MVTFGSKIKKVRCNSNAFTLVELMIAILISFLLMSAVYAFYISQERTAYVQQELAVIQQDLRAAMQILTRDIRMAGYDPTSSDSFDIVLNATFDNGGALSEAVTTTSLTFAATSDLDGDDNLDLGAEDVDGNGNIDLREIEQIAYRFDAVNNELEKYSSTTGIIEWQVVAENIQAIEFWYQLDDATWTLAPTAAEIPRIRSIRVSMLAVSSLPAQNYTNTNVYTAGSGTPFNGGAAYNDNLRRRLLVETVQCRNSGL